MSGQSSVGQPSVYEAGDQRNPPQSEINQAERYNEGTKHSHKNDDSSKPRALVLLVRLGFMKLS